MSDLIEQNLSGIKSLRPTSERAVWLWLLACDVTLFSLTYLASGYIRFQQVSFASLFDIVFLIYLFSTVFTLYIFNLYHVHIHITTAGLLARTTSAILTSSILVIPTIYFLTGSELLHGTDIGRGILLINFFLFTCAALTLRVFTARAFKRNRNKFNFLIIGKKSIAEEVWKEVSDSGFFGTLVFVVPDTEYAEQNTIPHLYSWQSIGALLATKWSQVVIADYIDLPSEVSDQIIERKLDGQNVVDLTEFYGMFWQKVPLFYLTNSWLLRSDGFRLVYSTTNKRIKRVWDLLFTTFICFPALPAIAAVSIAVKVFGGKGAVFYKQRRIGEGGKEFDIYKFRTMIDGADKLGTHYTHKKDSRITKIGKLLRTSRLDELPQIINILRGEMNLIGPRPEPYSIDIDLQKKIPYYRLKHILKPGITGWTQINCENGSTYENSIERLQYDIYYLKNYSIAMDVRIIFETAKVMLFGKGSR